MFQRFWKRKTAARLTVVALAALAALGCRAPKPEEAKEVVPELKLEGVRFRVYRDDALRAFGDAASASLRRDSSELRASDVVAILPREDGPPARVTAPTGEGSLVTRLFRASGGITLTRGDDAARTDSARFAPEPGGGLVRGDDPVVVEGRGYRLEGTGFTLDPAAGTIRVLGGAHLVAGGEGTR